MKKQQKEMMETIKEVVANKNYDFELKINKKGESYFYYKRNNGEGSGIAALETKEMIEMAKELTKTETTLEELIEDIHLKLEEVYYKDGEFLSSLGKVKSLKGEEKIVNVFIHNGVKKIQYYGIKNGKVHGRSFQGKVGDKIRPFIKDLMSGFEIILDK